MTSEKTMRLIKQHNATDLKRVRPIIFAAGKGTDKHTGRSCITYSVVEDMGSGLEQVVIHNRSGQSLNVDHDSIEALILALQEVQKFHRLH